MDELSAEQIAEFKEVFQIFDTDGNGTICEQELGIVLRALGQSPTDEEVKELLGEADQNENGVIEFNEFLTVMITLMNNPNNGMLSEDNLLHAFETFDKDGDKVITAPELKAFFHEIGEITVTDEESKEMIDSENTSIKGQMDFEEFKKMMTRNEDAEREKLHRKSIACLKSFIT